jgi:hypothetical protein
VNSGYLSDALNGQNIDAIDLQNICEIYKEHRIAKEARELIKNNITHKYIAKELVDELTDINARDGFNNNAEIERIVYGVLV